MHIREFTICFTYIAALFANVICRFFMMFCDMRGAMYLNVLDGCSYYARPTIFPIPLFAVFYIIDLLFLAIVVSSFLLNGLSPDAPPRKAKIAMLTSLSVSIALTLASILLIQYC